MLTEDFHPRPQPAVRPQSLVTSRARYRYAGYVAVTDRKYRLALTNALPR
jgi:hypothetical protein